MNSLRGLVAIVTGAGQGVGKGIALALSDYGVSIAVAGRTLSKCQETCLEIEGRGGHAIAIECDVKNAASLEHCVKQTFDTYGKINILVNNAQEVKDTLGNLLSISDDAITRGWESGAMAVFRLMKLCYPYLKGNGCIINLATAAAKRWDISNYGPYAAVKEAIRSLSRAAACEWAKDGIRTNVVMPLAKSPGLADWMNWNPKDAEEFMQSIPLGRVGECEEDIGRFVAVLCSDESRYVNGQTIALDGGKAYLG